MTVHEGWRKCVNMIFGLTRHGDSSHGVYHKRQEKVVDITFELECPLDKEDPATKQEESVKDCKRQEKIVEEVPLFHCDNGDETEEVSC